METQTSSTLLLEFSARRYISTVSIYNLPRLRIVNVDTLYTGWGSNEGQHFFIRIYIYIYTSFYSFVRGWSICIVWETNCNKDRLRQVDPYWPITSFLDHSTLCYLQDPLSTSTASWPGLLNRRPLRATAPSGSFSLTVNWLWLCPSLSPTDSTAKGICIYYFITSLHFRQDHMTLFRLFTQVHLWLTALSRVNMSKILSKKIL